MSFDTKTCSSLRFSVSNERIYFILFFAQHDNFYLIANIWSKAKKIFSINIYLL